MAKSKREPRPYIAGTFRLLLQGLDDESAAALALGCAALRAEYRPGDGPRFGRSIMLAIVEVARELSRRNDALRRGEG